MKKKLNSEMWVWASLLRDIQRVSKNVDYAGQISLQHLIAAKKHVSEECMSCNHRLHNIESVERYEAHATEIRTILSCNFPGGVCKDDALSKYRDLETSLPINLSTLSEMPTLSIDKKSVEKFTKPLAKVKVDQPKTKSENFGTW